jgi:hypothetical protein
VTRLALLIAAVVLLALPASAMAGRYQPGGSTWCGVLRGDSNNILFDVYAKNVSCKTARKVFARTVAAQRDKRGWTCSQYPFANGAILGTRCTASRQRRSYGIPRD